MPSVTISEWMPKIDDEEAVDDAGEEAAASAARTASPIGTP